jgi:alpha-galactosidase
LEFGGGGAIGAMEWSGAWTQLMKSGHSAEAAEWRATIPLNATPSAEGFLRPGDPAGSRRILSLDEGEVFALPAVHLVFFEGGRDEGGNAFRRYLRNNHCPNLSGQKPLPPLSYDHWFGLGLSIDENVMRKQASHAARLGIEYFVVDAGWYQGSAEALRKVLSGERKSCPWMLSEGNWDDCEREWFPKGIEPLADYVRSLGMKFGLFIEMPRSGRDGQWVRRHPELFIDIGGEILYMNLALKRAQDLVVETIENIIRRTGACWFRWEMGMGPLASWEQMQNPRFMFEYEAGLTSMMDRILAGHPDLFIELCGEGGNRIDLATLKRGHGFWFSDACENREVARTMQCGANRFLPANFANSALPVPSKTTMIGFLPHSPDPERRCDPSDADIVSRMCGGLQYGGDIARMSDSAVIRARCLNDVYKKIRHLLVQDYYPLAPQPQTPDDGEAVIFVSYDKTDAVLAAFSGIKDADCPVKKSLDVKGLNPELVYEVTDLLDDGKHICRINGKVLVDKGLDVTINKGAALYAINSIRGVS